MGLSRAAAIHPSSVSALRLSDRFAISSNSRYGPTLLEQVDDLFGFQIQQHRTAAMTLPARPIVNAQNLGRSLHHRPVIPDQGDHRVWAGLHA